MKIKERIIRSINDVISCYYTVADGIVLGEKESVSDNSPNMALLQEIQIIQRVKLGRNISLIGIFNPFLWISLFFDASRNIIYFNALNSCVMIAFGYVIMIKGRIDLNRHKKIKDQSIH